MVPSRRGDHPWLDVGEVIDVRYRSCVVLIAVVANQPDAGDGGQVIVRIQGLSSNGCIGHVCVVKRLSPTAATGHPPTVLATLGRTVGGFGPFARGDRITDELD